MKWSKLRHKPGAERERRGFLLLPLTIRQETRWLCWATWKERCYAGMNFASWMAERWVEKRPIAESVAKIQDRRRWGE